MLASYASELLVERSPEGPCSLWVLARGNDLDPSSEEDLRLLVESSRGLVSYSLLVAPLAPGLELRQDVTAAVVGRAETIPPFLTLEVDPILSRALFVWKDGTRRVDAGVAAAACRIALAEASDGPGRLRAFAAALAA